ncbi:MAG: hypothetical protein R6X02_01575 [Enhygromyxa sp.]
MRFAAVLGLSLGLLLGGCDRGQDGACPPCECECVCACDPQDPGGSGLAQAAGRSSSSDLSELTAAANRKLMHGDGKGCLADLDRIAAADPKLDKQLLMVRAQCRMAAGECQAGKQQVADYYVREMAMTRERAEKTAESLASMHCQGGDASERDRLLVAYFDLSDGAYTNKRDVVFCDERLAIIEELAPRVSPRDVEDSQITGGRQALFHTAAMCFARAGDCQAAYSHYRRLFPRESLDLIADPAMRESVVRDSFDSSIALCKGKP